MSISVLTTNTSSCTQIPILDRYGGTNAKEGHGVMGTDAPFSCLLLHNTCSTREREVRNRISNNIMNKYMVQQVDLVMEEHSFTLVLL